MRHGRSFATPGPRSGIQSPNRFESSHHDLDLEQVEDDADYLAALGRPVTEFLPDRSRSLICKNDSPDVGFEVSLNPYRGCEHGCIYCYARPTHEYLGFSAGLDFETRILVKHDAPELLRRELMAPGWKPRVLGCSGVTDPYQPVERRLRLTRRCLEVLAEFRQAVAIVTKNRLVTRDIDLLGELARHQAAGVSCSRSPPSTRSWPVSSSRGQAGRRRSWRRSGPWPGPASRRE